MDANFIEYCIKTGVLSQENLRIALAKVDANVPIYKALILYGAISQEQLAITAGDFYHSQVVDLSRVTPDPKALSYGSDSVCRRYAFVPFAIDSVAGVLVAIADYTQTPAVAAFLKDSRVERMKFYIAPFDMLQNLIKTCYDNEKLCTSSSAQNGILSSRKLSILRTQYADLDNIQAPSGEINPQLERKFQSISSELAAYKEENSILQQRIDQLSSTLELEASFVRELAKILKSSGAMDAQSFDRLLASQR